MTPRQNPAALRRRTILTGAVALVSMGALAACSNDRLAEDYRAGSNKGYISGDGTVTEIHSDDRTDPIVFEGTSEAGDTISSDALLGDVVVVNFWYASCAPCRAEAGDLAALHTEFDGQKVSFVGINVRDQPAQALAFNKTYGIEYPSIMDTDGKAQLAFAGKVPPDAVPTTLVLDARGRVASRILGQIQDKSILKTLVNDTLAEAS